MTEAFEPSAQDEEEVRLGYVQQVIATPGKAHMRGRFVVEKFFDRFIYVFDDALVEVTPFRSDSMSTLRLTPRAITTGWPGRAASWDRGLQRKAVAVQLLGDAATSSDVAGSVRGTLRIAASEIVGVDLSEHGRGSLKHACKLVIRAGDVERTYQPGLSELFRAGVVALLEPLLEDRLYA